MPNEQQPDRRVRTITERHARKGHGTAFYVLVFVTAVLVLNALFGEKGLLAMMRARREYNLLNAEVTRLRQENAKLGDKVRRLRDDPATIEDLARRKLGLIRPGEKMFTITDVPPDTPPSISPAPVPPKNKK